MARLGCVASALAVLATFMSAAPARAQSSPVKYLDPTWLSSHAPGGVDSYPNISYDATADYSETNVANWGLLDHFDDTLGTSIENHMTDDRFPWKRHSTIGPVTIQSIDGSTRARPVSGAGLTTVTAATSLIDGDVDLWLTLKPETVGGGWVNPRILVRAHVDLAVQETDPAAALDGYWWVEVRKASKKLVMGSMDEGVPTTNTSTTTTDTLPDGPIRVHVSAQGDVLKAQVFAADTPPGTPSTDAAKLSPEMSWTPPASYLDANGPGTDDDVTRYFRDQTSVGASMTSAHYIDDVQIWHPRQLDLSVPKDGETTRAVTAIIHGGAFEHGDRTDMVDWMPEFTDRGYATANIGYRQYLRAEIVATLPSNSMYVDRSGSSGSWTLTMGTATVTNLLPTYGAAELAARISELGALPAGTYRTWAEPAAPDRLWITFKGAIPAPFTASGTGGTTATASPAFHDLGKQLQQSRICLDAGPLGVGPACYFGNVLEAYECAIANGNAWPPAADTCNLGFVFAAQGAVRRALDDVQTAIRWIKGNPDGPPGADANMDTSLLFATGESAGGILSTSLAYRPEDWTGGPDDTDPDPGAAPDSRVTGAAPYAAGWMVNGRTESYVGAPPVAFFQRDLDTVYYPGALQGFTRDLIRRSRASSTSAEYHGLCGVGHGGSTNTPQPIPLGAAEWAKFVDEVVKFLHPLVAPSTSPYAGREGAWYGSATTETFTEVAAEELVGTAQALPGDFDGDGRDDIYWRSADGACDSLWLSGQSSPGTADRTFNPTPTADPTQRHDAPKNPYHSWDPFITDAPGAGTVPTVGDFDGDGTDDIFWYGPGAASDSVWYGNGHTMLGQSQPLFDKRAETVSGTYSAVFAGNFGTGSGNAAADDIYLFNASGDDAVLYGLTRPASAPYFQSIALSPGFNTAGTVQPVVGDYDGDQNDDIFWYGPGLDADGAHYGQQNAGGTGADAFEERAASVLANYKAVVAGNFGIGTAPALEADADDLYFFDHQDRWDFVWYGTKADASKPDGVDERAFTVMSMYYGFDGGTDAYTVLSLDLSRSHAEGDGEWDDLVFYSPTGADAVWYGQQNSPSPTVGNAFDEADTMPSLGTGYVPITGDFDGDGYGDIIWRRPT